MMGVKGFITLLRSCNCSWDLVPIDSFAGKKLAIDASMFLYQFKTQTLPLATLIVDLLLKFRRAKIEPVFIFDGAKLPEKEFERQQRYRRKNTIRTNLALLEQQLGDYKRDQVIGAALAKLVNNNKYFYNKLSNGLNEHNIQIHLAKLQREVASVTPQDHIVIRDILTAFKIPFYRATHEGEMMCAAMAKAGLVDGVVSGDSDAFPAGAPLVIRSIEGTNFRVLTLKKILQHLELEFPSFFDLCILCGTDFNQKIVSVGPVTALNLIKKFGSVASIASQTNYDTTSLLYEKNVAIYEIGLPNPFVMAAMGTPTRKTVRCILQKYGVKTNEERIFFILAI